MKRYTPEQIVAKVWEAASSLPGRRVCVRDMRTADLSVVSGVVSAE